MVISTGANGIWSPCLRQLQQLTNTKMTIELVLRMLQRYVTPAIVLNSLYLLVTRFMRTIFIVLSILLWAGSYSALAQKPVKPKPAHKVQRQAEKKKENMRESELKAYEEFRKQNKEMQTKEVQKRMKKASKKAKRNRQNKSQERKKVKIFGRKKSFK